MPNEAEIIHEEDGIRLMRSEGVYWLAVRYESRYNVYTWGAPEHGCNVFTSHSTALRVFSALRLEQVQQRQMYAR